MGGPIEGGSWCSRPRGAYGLNRRVAWRHRRRVRPFGTVTYWHHHRLGIVRGGWCERIAPATHRPPGRRA